MRSNIKPKKQPGNGDHRKLRVAVGAEPEIEGPAPRPDVPPGDYLAYSRRARVYPDPGYKRWVCLIVFEILDDAQNSLGTAPLFLNMGKGAKAKASLRGRFLAEWCRANGGPPKRGDRFSMRVFVKRMARVRITRSTGPLQASKVEKILGWETGSSIQPVTHSRTAAKKAGSSNSLQEMDGRS